MKMRLLWPSFPSGNDNFSKVNTRGEGNNPILALLFNTICQTVGNIGPGFGNVVQKAVILEKIGVRKKWELSKTLGQLQTCRLLL